MFECAMMQQFYAPDMYWRNPYNVLGLPISASARDVRRKLEDILGMMSIGNSRQSACVAILPKRLNLDVKDIEALAELLFDPYSRAFYTLFWFWPAEDIESKSDEAINRIVTGRPEDRKWALSHWYDIVDADEDTAEVLIAKHNLAVYFHLVSLMFEDDFIHGGVITSSDCERYWKQAIAYWDQVADNDYFWDIFEEGCISQFDDPRMTSGFVRSFRHDFPLGFDQINASLLKIYIEKKDAENVARQIKYMKQSQCGLDDVESSLEFVASGVEKSIFRFLDNKTSEIGACEREGAALAEQILEHYASIEKIVALLSAETSLNADAIKDRVAMAAQHCVVAYGNTTKDWEKCLVQLQRVLFLAVGENALSKIRESLGIVRGYAEASQIDNLYRSIAVQVWNAPDDVKADPKSGLVRARFIINHSAEYLAEAKALSSRLMSFKYSEFADRLAQVVQVCLIEYCNATENYQPCLQLQERLLEIAKDDGVRARIRQNLEILTKNAESKEFETPERFLTKKIVDPGDLLLQIKMELDVLSKEKEKICHDIYVVMQDVVERIRADKTKCIDLAKRVINAYDTFKSTAYGRLGQLERDAVANDLALTLLSCIPVLKPNELPFGTYDVNILEPLISQAEQMAVDSKLRHELHDWLVELRYDKNVLERHRDLYKRCWICKSAAPNFESGEIITLSGDRCDVKTIDRHTYGTCRTVSVLVPRCESCAKEHAQMALECRSKLRQIKEARDALNSKGVFMALLLNRGQKDRALRNQGFEATKPLDAMRVTLRKFPLVTEYLRMKFCEGVGIDSYITTHPRTYYRYESRALTELLICP